MTRGDKLARTVSPARLCAFEILRRVEEEGAFASVLLATDERVAPLRAEDRALCHEIVLGVLRWQLWLDALSEHYARRKPSSFDAPVRRSLSIGLYQLRFLSRIPVSAIVNESVNLTYAARVHSAAGFVNAVLRRAAREADYDPAAHVSDPFKKLAVQTSHPAWLIERWINAFGFDETEAFARANNEAPPTAFRLLPKSVGKNNVNDHTLQALGDELDALQAIREAGGELVRSEIAPDAWRVAGAGSANLRELAKAGKIYLQDEASQLVAHVLDARKRERVLDVCAAPGSKTTHISELSGCQAFIVAGDLYEHRLQMVAESARRQNLSCIQLLAHDAERAIAFAPESFDRVLVDAPCTGTGTLRRNPEIRWRITPSDIAELSARQRRILANAAKLVRRGGRLVYSTCSVEPEENESVVAAFLSAHKEYEQTLLNAPEKLRTASGAVRTWPQRDGADGFFIAAFARRAER